MFENIIKLFKKIIKKESVNVKSKEAAKERLHLVLMQDRANVSADFLDLMRQEIIEVIKKYIDIDESSMDVRLTNQTNDDGTQGAPALYANIPILNIKDETKTIKKENENNINNIKLSTEEKDCKEEIKDNIQEKTENDKKENKNEESKEELNNTETESKNEEENKNENKIEIENTESKQSEDKKNN